MYSKRIKIFVILAGMMLLICVLRLVQMQLLSGSYYRDQIDRLKLERGRSRQLGTIRGRILDRNEMVLATDEPQFRLCINYRLTCVRDERVSLTQTPAQLQSEFEDLQQIISKCSQLAGLRPSEIEDKIRTINDSIWNRRAFIAWRRKFSDSPLLKKHDDILGIPIQSAMEDFENREPDPVERRRLVNRVNIIEMHRDWPLIDLKTDDDVFTAQLEFLDTDDVVILPKASRRYPYAAAAAQTIGWVGSASQKQDRRLFEDDRLASYLEGEVCGREDGAEFVCEKVLRGRRGELIRDIDRQVVSRTPTQFGRDVRLTLDIELQRRIQEYVADPEFNANYRAPTAAVVIDVASADILALVSLPAVDLNRVRYDYSELIADANRPLLNRAVDKQYPPGSVIKPLILIAGIESGKIGPHDAISCPAKAAPKHWPNCWIYNRYRSGHDVKWNNNARNAIRGSCNIYFSRLADRIGSLTLQRWLYDFGYGHEILFPPAHLLGRNHANRNFRQAPGQISTTPDPNVGKYFDKIPDIAAGEKRIFGMGQGNLRATPLQVANAMAAIARKGLYKGPRLLMPDPNHPDQDADSLQLPVSERTLAVVYDGMSAVVNESGGTAYQVFSASGLAQQGIEVYGKTGSTQEPDNAWFGGFATDSSGRTIALAIVVEGGQHGSSDAAPIAAAIIQFSIDAGYLATTAN
ncbi:MAG: penicillin-binding transpeptidase domain-containing protein, partial [Planctomycetota bacterium]